MTDGRLSRSDRMMLASETPTQHIHNVATIVLRDEGDGPLWDRITARVRSRLPLVDFMHQRIWQPPVGAPRWVEDPDVLVERHLRHMVLGPDAGLEELARLVGRVASEPLPTDRPPWEAWLVEGLADGRAALVAKVHHAAVDGVSGIAALGAVFDLQAGVPAADTAPDPSGPVEAGSRRPSPLRVGLEELERLPRRPARLGASVVGVTSGLAGAWRHRADAPLPMTAPRLSFNRALTPRRSVALAGVGLAEVKAVRRAHGVTVNDVLVTVVAASLRRWLAKHDELPARPLVASVPVDERRPEHGLLGNHISAMLYALPVHLDDPVERLRAVARSAAVSKEVHGTATGGFVDHLATLLAVPGGRLGLQAWSRLGLANVAPPLVNLIVSSLRGPAFPLHGPGTVVTDVFPLGPLIDGVGLGVTVASYLDGVRFGFIACPDLLPDVDTLAAHVPDALAELAHTA